MTTSGAELKKGGNGREEGRGLFCWKVNKIEERGYRKEQMKAREKGSLTEREQGSSSSDLISFLVAVVHSSVPVISWVLCVL